MLMTARGPYADPESTTTKWLIIFILLSLLAHAIIIAAILLITVFMPAPKVPEPKPDSNEIVLTMQPPPAVPKPQKPIFVPTTPEANAQHKQQLVQSANDHDLTSKAKVARAPDSIMPDVTGQEHNPSLNASPQIKAPETPQPSTTPPTPKQAKPRNQRLRSRSPSNLRKSHNRRSPTRSQLQRLPRNPSQRLIPIPDCRFYRPSPWQPWLRPTPPRNPSPRHPP